jgi:SAM-dependent methyltransferase
MQYAPYDIIAAEYYDDFHMTCRNFDAATKEALQHKKNNIRNDGLILDVGSGRGRCVEFLGVSPSRIIQLDSSQAMLNNTPREDCLLQVHHIAETLPFLNETFSCVVSFLCDPFFGLEFLSEGYRVLKKGGIFIATMPSFEWGKALRKELNLDISVTRFKMKDGKEVRVPSILVSNERMLSMLVHSGFPESQISISKHKLPKDHPSISLDVVTSASRLRCEPTSLDLVYLICASK